MAATSPMAAAAALRKANNVSCTSATAAKLSRTEYMSWLNTLLASSYTEAKELGTGEAYCQFVHAIFPEAIQLKKVKWNSQAQADWSDNLKLMAMALKSLGVVKIIAVERLVECKTMENFEFLQWCYLFYAANKKYAPENYDALAARGGIIIPKYRNENERLSAQARAGALISPRARAEMLRSPNEQSQAMLGRREQQQQQQQYQQQQQQQQPYQQQQQQQYQQQEQYQQQQQQQQTAAALEAQLRQYAEAAEILQREKEELAEDLREADKDRNDYYAKLCAIETYCKAAREEDQSAKTVLNLLYKAEAEQRAQAEQQQQQQQRGQQVEARAAQQQQQQRAQQQEARAAQQQQRAQQQQQQRAQQEEEESCAAQQQRAQEEARAAQRAYELCCNRVESAEMNANEEAMEQERAM